VVEDIAEAVGLLEQDMVEVADVDWESAARALAPPVMATEDLLRRENMTRKKQLE
jgi:hypothetical protein